MIFKPSLREVADKLASFGSADAIALHFESEGIVGQPHHAYRCAVSSYITAVMGQPVGVCSTYLRLRDTPDKVELANTEVPINVEGYAYPEYKPIVDFIFGFDRKQYPHLIAEGSR